MPDPCPNGGLCCNDVELAACVEQGLPISSKPFADCAKRLGRSELRVIAHLSAWRRTGQLECLAMKPPPNRVPQPGTLALWQHVDVSDEALQGLGAQLGVDRVIEAPGSPDWPWRLSVVLRATPRAGLEALRERLGQAGLSTDPDVCLALRIEQPRDQAMLFSTDSRATGSGRPPDA